MVWFGSVCLLAQTVGSSAAANPAALAYLALRRWCGGLTLSPSRPSPDWSVLWVAVGAIVTLAFLAAAFQGPWRTSRQILDLPGHVRFFQETTRRLKLSVRLVTSLLAFTVLSWTAAQALDFASGDSERGRVELLLLERSRGAVELIAEHGAAAAVTPLRDVAGLADNLPLILAAAALLLSTRTAWSLNDRSWREDSWRASLAPNEKAMAWELYVWGAIALYTIYRLFCKIAGSGGLPVGSCLGAEVILVPGLMLVCDGFLLAWCLSELRGDDRGERIDPFAAFNLMPIACLACLAALPARYVATAILLATQHVSPTAMSSQLGGVLRWSLGPGPTLLQGASLVSLGVVGVAAWSGGALREAPSGFTRLLAREGGRLTLVVVAAVLATGALSASAYILLSLLPPAGWVLGAADAYSHYATLPIGLWTLSALVQLGEWSLPTARLIDGGGTAEASASAAVGSVENASDAASA